ncbi:aldehyde dehydrogenase family protein [Chengkuizengella sp. 2205SS18-9]|uniref:Aldehyde dehydrogenase family protein n=2 Tax=Chengkuizengella axinellae TaxID=3064388 RepID=A0ABT9IXW9_9BACL|nr:aldehyde dehydrogenase family protein [Chengkuizengella sp. 2205SS18-9]MDP5274207.1 aldehyde dehydrogenase family protein [Chengkuizengella sp. 2205SS18-9]
MMNNKVIKVSNFIDGQWDDYNENTITNVNPATLEHVSTVNIAAEADVQRAVESSKIAFKEWSSFPPPKRGEILYKIAEELKKRKQELSELMTLEMGKVITESEGEVQEAIDMAYYMGGEGRRLTGEVVPSELPNKMAMAVREPLGVIGAISAFNFPIAVPSWKIFPSLIIGNTVVWKPSPNTSATAAAFVKCMVDAGLPKGVINLIVGGDGDVGHTLVTHPDISLVSFTGSTHIGQKVYQSCASNHKQVSLELGGKNGIIVLEDADLPLAARAIAWGAFGTTGQRCTSTSRVIVQKSVLEELTPLLLKEVSLLKIGNGIDHEVNVGPLINSEAIKRVEDYVALAKKEGIEIHCGGNKIGEEGYFFEPTVIGPVSPSSKYATEEIFGPILSIISVDTFEEAIEVNNSVDYGLSSAIFTRDLSKAMKAVRRVDTGIVYINHSTSGAEIQMPFGGTKNTGNGKREAGQAALDTFCEWKTIYIDYSGDLQRAQIDVDFS